MVDMMKLGKTIENTTTSVKLHTFDMSSMVWSSEGIIVEFVIDTEPFGSEGFREAFKATSRDKEFSNKTWAVKRYIQEAVDNIVSVGQTVKQQSTKTVQMHFWRET